MEATSMARPRRVDKILLRQARAVVGKAASLEELRCAQAVLLPGMLGATLEQTAAVLGVGRATVPRLQARLRGPSGAGKAARPRRGGLSVAGPTRLAQGCPGHAPPKE